MTASYVAWNGESYPWPPPDGWYQASDGRWWAAGSGPNPPGVAPAAPAGGQATPQPNPNQPAPGQPGPQPGLGQQPTVIARGPAPGAASPGAPYQPPPGAPSGPAGPATAPPPGALGPLPQATSQGAQAGWQQAPSGGSGSKTPLIIGGLALIGVLALGGVFLATRGDDTTTASDASTTSAPDIGEDTTPDAPTTVATTTPTTAAPTTVPTTVATAPPDTLSEEESVIRFRDILLANDLDSSDLSDEDIVSFGVSFCLLALLSEDMGDFVEFREETIAESETQLSDQELALVVDAVIVSFCPDEADRLGLSI